MRFARPISPGGGPPFAGADDGWTGPPAPAASRLAPAAFERLSARFFFGTASVPFASPGLSAGENELEQATSIPSAPALA